MTRKTLLILLVLISLQLSVACSPAPTSPAPTSPTPQANMPNPASVHCEQNGGKLELGQDASGGITGVCVFPDGSKCEEWAYFRGECKPGKTPVSPIPTPSPESKLPNPASVFCEQHGNQLKIVTAGDGSQNGVCIFPNGSTCDEWAYFRGECKPGNSPVSPIPTPSPESKLPNPASVFCEQHGNQLEIVTADDGSQNGVCIFPDGSTCNEWAYFRGECGPAN